MIQIEKINEAYIKIHCEPDIAYEIKDFFTFKMPGYQFTPSYRNKQWDGNVYLFNPLTQQIYAGLLSYVEAFAQQREYEITYLSDFSADEFSVKEAKEFIKSLNLTLEPRPYQLESLVHCIRNKRTLLLSPTSSGKSLIIYMLYRYYNVKTLLIVPTIGLIHQMMSDFISYGDEDVDNILTIFSGQEKGGKQNLYISTWQSIYQQPKGWFDQFDLVIGDEAHGFKSKSLVSIMTKLTTCSYRFGTTGTLDGSKTHKLVLEGLFGPVHKVITTSELIEQKYASQFCIKNIILSYPDEHKKQLCKLNYQQEIDFLCQLKKRNRFIINLALSLEGNTLVLFRYVEKHGKPLYEMLKQSNPDCPIYFISGEIDGTERENIRNILNKNEKSILIGSEGTVSTGVNIPRLHNAIFASPSKARIKNLQAIGRILRLADDKDFATLYDISDDFSYTTKSGNLIKNYTMTHFMERIKIYNEEKFNYKNYRVSIKI
jgi:superfamily II DNA or RNA helicase